MTHPFFGKILAAATCSFLLSPAWVVVAAEPSPVGDIFKTSPGDWQYVETHSDEFDGAQVDAAKWNTDPEDWGTWSWEPSNAAQKGGQLHLRMVQKSHRRGDKELAYTSGVARQKQTATYGYFEARVKGCQRFPGASPAFWLYSIGPQNRFTARDGETVGYSEIDIIELQQGEYDFKSKQNNGVDVIDCNLHNVLIRNGQRQWQRPGTHPDTNKNEYHAPFDPRDDFHVYAVENTPDFVTWYIDGKQVARRPNLYWHLPMHITLSLGLRRPFENYANGERAAILDQTTQEGFPTWMSVDYVRVWQNQDVEAPTAVAQTPKGKPNASNRPKPPMTKATATTEMTKADFIAAEKTKWEQNGWPWNQAKVESNFAEVDTNQDGIASGLERKEWFETKKASAK